MEKQFPGLGSALLVGSFFGALLWLERRHALRRPVEPKLKREVRNVAVAALSAVAVQLAERPAIMPLTALVERRGWGFAHWIPLPHWGKLILALILMDYTLYVWHVLVHKVPWLWRFHLVHHVDLDLDASTALRFHFAELLVSVPWRAAQILVIGTPPRAYSLWQTALVLSILFHHSNVKLPIRVERWLSRFVVTPRMHGIHHSFLREETNSNWSSGLTLWDWLHGTLKLNVPQDEITIGVPAYRQAEEVTLPKILRMPFEAQRPTWELPDDEEPTRAASTPARSDLLP